jgi:hypothetical protein
MLGIFQAPNEVGPALKYVYNFNWRIAVRKGEESPAAAGHCQRRWCSMWRPGCCGFGFGKSNKSAAIDASRWSKLLSDPFCRKVWQTTLRAKI